MWLWVWCWSSFNEQLSIRTEPGAEAVSEAIEYESERENKAWMSLTEQIFIMTQY